jgi:hypothetical protein
VNLESLFPALLAAGILALGMVAPGGSLAAGDPHDFDALGCPACHTGDDPGPDDLRSGLATVCRQCHTPCPQGRKHVGTNGVPSAMGQPLPLESTMTMTCHTCHAPHDSAVDQAGRKTLYLRLPMGPSRTLCFNCHGGIRK